MEAAGAAAAPAAAAASCCCACGGMSEGCLYGWRRTCGRAEGQGGSSCGQAGSCLRKPQC